MVRQTVTLKLPFLRLNAAKATEFARLQDLNTEVANGILALSPAERSDLTTAHFTNVEIGQVKAVVRFAQDHSCGLRLEGLSSIRQRTRQRQDTKRDAGHNRDYWPYFDLETKICYKAALAGVPVEKVPAAYTGKSCCRCGAIGIRERQSFRCPRGAGIGDTPITTPAGVWAAGSARPAPWCFRRARL
jgi:IS605 OrfB family transposase